MQKQRVTIAILAVITATMALAGCGPSDSGTPAKQASSSAPAPTNSAESTGGGDTGSKAQKVPFDPSK